MDMSFSEIYKQIINEELTQEEFIELMNQLTDFWYEQGFLDNLFEEK